MITEWTANLRRNRRRRISAAVARPNAALTAALFVLAMAAICGAYAWALWQVPSP